MNEHVNVGAYKRVRGGFRRFVETELGEEQFCGSCQESWPFDAEFFLVKASRISYECKACIKERRTLLLEAESLARQVKDATSGKQRPLETLNDGE